jgi:hypothetical protein
MNKMVWRGKTEIETDFQVGDRVKFKEQKQNYVVTAPGMWSLIMGQNHYLIAPEINLSKQKMVYDHHLHLLK